MTLLYLISGLYILGHVLFGVYFLMNAYSHLLKTNDLVGYAQAKGVPSPRMAVIVSGVLLLLGGLSYVISPFMGVTLWGFFALCRFALVIFLIPVTLKMHAFWRETDPQKKSSTQIDFYKNVALLAAVLMTLV